MKQLQQITCKERLLLFRPKYLVWLFKIKTRITHFTVSPCILIHRILYTI